MAKKKKKVQTLSNEAAFEAFLNDQDKRKQEESKGQIRYREAAKSSRPQYTLEGYQGSSKEKQYKWETDLLKPLSIKRFGRSYNDKFSNLMKKEGMSGTDADEYRKYMDFQEDRKQEYRLNDEGMVDNRQSIRAGQGAHLKSEVIDGIFKNMDQRIKASQQIAKNKEIEKETEPKKEKISKKDEEPSTIDKVKGFFTGKYDIYGDPIEKSQAQVKKHLGKNTSASTIGKVLPGQKVDEVDRFLANIDPLGINKELAIKRGDKRALNELYNTRKFGEGGGTDMIAKGLGYIAPASELYKGLNASKLGIGLTKFGTTEIAKNASKKEIAKAAGKRLVTEGAKGAIVGNAISDAEVGIREAINPKNQNALDNAKYIGMNTAIGAVADPLLYGMGKGVSRGLESASNRTMKNLLPKNEEVATQFANVMKTSKGDTALPIQSKTVPNWNEGQNFIPKINPTVKPSIEVPSVYKKADKNAIDDFAQELMQEPQVKANEPVSLQTVKTKKDVNEMTKSELKQIYDHLAQKHDTLILLDDHGASEKVYQNQLNAVKNDLDKVKQLLKGEQQNIPKNAYQQELDDAVQKQYDYLKNSMGKGVDYGTTSSNGGLGNFKEVNGSFSVSRNPKWYQDFYKQNGRKPTNAELRELAIKHVKEGFEDETGKIPAWSPKKVQEFDKEIEKVTEIIRQTPEQEEVLAPLLNALKEDRNAALKEYGMDPNKQYQYMKVKGDLPENIQAMQNEIIPLRQPTGKKVKPITRQQLIKSMKKNLGVTLRHGRLGNVDDNVSGYFRVDSEVIRTRDYGDVGVMSHEIGHHLDKQFKLTNPAFDNELLKLGKTTSGKGYTQDQIRDEGLAEYIRLYLTDPQKAIAEAPKFSQHLETVLPKKVKIGLQKTQADVDRWIEQGPEMRLRGKIDRTGKEQISVGEKVDKLYSQFIDKFDRLKKVEKAVTGKINSAENSLYKKARLSVGAPKKAEMVLRDFKDVLKPIEKYGYTMKDVSDYSAAVHAKELELLDIESGMTKEEIEKVIAKFDTPEMKQVHQGIIKYNNMLLDMLQQGQVISKESVDAMKKKYPNYVPFYRFFEDDIAQGLGNKGFTNLTNPVKRLKGSTRDIIDPLESMIKNTFAVVNAVEKNKVGLELSRLADIEGAGKFVERLHGAQQVKKEHIVTVFENGEKVQYQLDKDLYEAIQQLDEDVTNKVIQFLSIPTSTLRAGATLTPEFMLRNPIRDQFQAYVVSNYGYKPIIDLPLGAWEVFKGKALNKDGLYKQWAKEGGGYGNYLSQDRNYLRETLDHIHKEGSKYQRGFKTIVNPKEWIKVLQAMSEFTEEATKLGEFRRAIKKGASPQEAAFQARDLMDFGRVGSDMKQWNRAVAFLNANMQGKDKIARAFKQNPVRSTIRAITGVTLPAIGAYVAMDKFANEKQKETYANTPKWMKDTFFILPIPGTDELARIPKPFDLAPVFANPVEQIMDYIKGNDPDTWGEFLKRQALEISSVPHMLTGLAPIIENITNYSFFTGGPIVPRRDQDLLPEDQYGVTTSLTARTAGKLTGTSPYKVDNLIRGYGAGLGKYATSGVDNLLEVLNVGKLPPQEAKKWSELPVVNAFTVDSTGGGQIMTDFYDTLDKFKKEKNSAKRNDKSYDREGDYKYLNKTGLEIGKLRNQYREIQSDYNMTPQQKRLELDELDRQMNELAREALINIGEKTK